MLELEALLPELLEWFTTSSIDEWPALTMAVLTAVASKATGGFYRIREAKKDSPDDAAYITAREIDNLIIVGVITLFTQVVAFKPAVALVKKMLPKLVTAQGTLSKNVEALVRMALFAPGLFASESLSRRWAGQKKHDLWVKERQRFNEKIMTNWQKLINSSQGQSLLALTYNGPIAALSHTGQASLHHRNLLNPRRSIRLKTR
jgi:hypothetical protein